MTTRNKCYSLGRSSSKGKVDLTDSTESCSKSRIVEHSKVLVEGSRCWGSSGSIRDTHSNGYQEHYTRKSDKTLSVFHSNYELTTALT